MIFVVTSVGFIALDNREALDPVKTGIHDLIVPVTDVFNDIGEGSGDETELQARYDELESKYKALTAEYTQLVVNAREIDQLREMLNLEQSQPNLSFVPARVSYLD